MNKAVALVRQELAALRRGERSGLRRLKPWHCEVIAGYCDGRSMKALAEDHGVSEGAVKNIIRDPSARPLVDSLMGAMDAEFRGLYAHVIEGVRVALLSNDVDVRLKGIDVWMKVQGKYKQDPQNARPLSAEDIVAKLLEAHRQGNPAKVTLEVSPAGGSESQRQPPKLVNSQAWVDVGDENVSDKDILEEF